MKWAAFEVLLNDVRCEKYRYHIARPIEKNPKVSINFTRGPLGCLLGFWLLGQNAAEEATATATTENVLVLSYLTKRS